MTEHKFIICTDTHDKMRMPYVKCPDALAWLHGGDFYMRRDTITPRAAPGYNVRRFSRMRKLAFDKWLSRLEIPLYAVRGNHDIEDLWGFFKACVDVTGKLVQPADALYIAGLGWHGDGILALPAEDDLQQVCESLSSQVQERLNSEDRLILLTHYPVPTDMCPGHECIGEFVERFKPLAVIQGHWHHAFGKTAMMEHGDNSHTLVVNPGSRGGILTVRPDEGFTEFTQAPR